MAKTESGLVQAVVAPRRTLIVQTSSGVNRRVSPGAVVNLPAEEVQRLTAAGFLVGGAAASQAGRPSQPQPLAQPTINGRTGSQVGPDPAASGEAGGKPDPAA